MWENWTERWTPVFPVPFTMKDVADTVTPMQPFLNVSEKGPETAGSEIFSLSKFSKKSAEVAQLKNQCQETSIFIKKCVIWKYCMVLSLKKKNTLKFVLCKFKRSILNKELPIISKMSEPDKRGHGMLGADSKPGEKNVTVELTPPAKAGPENLEILPLIINPYTHRH